MAVLATLVGLAAGFGALGFRYLVNFFQLIAYGSEGNLLEIIKPYLPDIVICVECIFTWYWIADFCEERDIPFVLGHALYMKAIHGSKTKSDKLDSEKIAKLLKAGMLPMSYVYPRDLRSTRDLLRRRIYLKRKRAELLAHIQNTKSQYKNAYLSKCINI